MFFDDEFDRIFQRVSRSFMGLDDIFEKVRESGNLRKYGPFYYGYTMTVGPDGKPVVKEYGNVRPGLLPTSDTKEPLADTFVDEKTKTLKIIAEMPGVEKKDINIVVEGKNVNIEAKHGEKKYQTKVPIKEKVDENSVSASYTNGILEVHFKLKEAEKPKGKRVEVS